MRRQFGFLLLAGAFVWVLSQGNCSNPKAKTDEQPFYRNHGDSAKYVGIDACKQCHSDKYNTYIHTGMGHSFRIATPERSDGDFTRNKPVFDKYKNLWYWPHFADKDLYITEFRLEGKDTVHTRSEKVKYIIGSGHHTNSHLVEVNGYLYQAPLTYYTQEKKWDLPPGFENGQNTRFDRMIGHECLACHNALPDYEEGSENRFTKVPLGITCERCHGPGSLHVAEKKNGIIIDVKNGIDRSIVNPAKLNVEQQVDLCQRCHLQGNSVLKPGKDWDDFRPGMKLSDFIEVYMPRYAGDENTFIMAGHAQRLQRSKCFLQSSVTMNLSKGQTKNSELKTSNLTCLTCHNPHVSVRETGVDVFNNTCKKCHADEACKELPAARAVMQNSCTNCHMPRNSSSDIPHVAVTDHYIRVVKKEIKIESKKIFAGLQCINNPKADSRSRAVAYLNAFEQSNNTQHTLDSAIKYISSMKKDDEKSSLLVRYNFLSENYGSNLSAKAQPTDPDAWTCYRLSESFYAARNFSAAQSWIEKALLKGKGNLQFQLKLSTILIQQNQLDKAEALLKKVMALNPKLAQAACNLSYIYKLKNMPTECEAMAKASLALNPDYQEALLNLGWAQQTLGKEKELARTMKRLEKLGK